MRVNPDMDKIEWLIVIVRDDCSPFYIWMSAWGVVAVGYRFNQYLCIIMYLGMLHVILRYAPIMSSLTCPPSWITILLGFDSECLLNPGDINILFQQLTQLGLYHAVLEIVVEHRTFSDQNCWLSEQFWFWLDKMSRQIEYDFRTLYVHTLSAIFSVPFAIILCVY